LSNTFYGCEKLIDTPIIPDGVIDMSNTFVNCINLVNISEIPNSVINMCNTYLNCFNLTGDIIIHSENITDATNCFDNTELNKIVYIPFMNDGINTETYSSFLNAEYSDQVRKDGVLLKDINDRNTVFAEWRYNTTNDIKTLYEYLGSNTTIVVPNISTVINNYTNGETTIESNTPFYNNQNVVIADLMYVPFVNNDMSSAFYNDENLTDVLNISNSITNMSNAFANCHSLINVSVIPDSVTNMSNTFANCYSLVDAPIIPDSVTDMSGIFYQCSLLSNVPAISNSVTNLSDAFYGCSEFSGDIYIHSENITDVTNCFYGTYSEKNVYIHFTYDNGVNTPTYNAFINANYGEGINGVTLVDIDGENYDFESDYDFDVDENRNVRLKVYIGENTIVDTPHLNI
jgi:hypothetical protein